eukprot:2525514-Amphidinium_carterae.1
MLLVFPTLARSVVVCCCVCGVAVTLTVVVHLFLTTSNPKRSCVQGYRRGCSVQYSNISRRLSQRGAGAKLRSLVEGAFNMIRLTTESAEDYKN